MPLYSVSTTIQTADNNAENYATNTVHTVADDLTALVEFCGYLETFYLAIDTYFSDLTKSTGGASVKAYALADPKPRAPVYEDVYTLVPGSGAPLPPEVSLCLSFQSPRESGEPQARRRGRIYLPFFGETANGTDGRPAPAMITAIANAAATLGNSCATSTNLNWVVYSPTSGDSDYVSNGWIDNEWDTQRRRGRKMTTRNVWP